MAKNVTRIVKGPKGLWINEGDGFVQKVDGEKVSISPETAASKARNLYAVGEYEALQAAQAASVAASQAEKDERAEEEEEVTEVPEVPEVKKTSARIVPPVKGAGSKES